MCRWSTKVSRVAISRKTSSLRCLWFLSACSQNNKRIGEAVSRGGSETMWPSSMRWSDTTQKLPTSSAGTCGLVTGQPWLQSKNESVLRVKDNSDGVSRGLGGDGPKWQQRHSSISGSVGGTYGPIIMVQSYHFMHIPPLSQPPMCLDWNASYKSFRFKNVTDWNFFWSLLRVMVMAGWCGCTKYYNIKEKLDPLIFGLNIFYKHSHFIRLSIYNGSCL